MPRRSLILVLSAILCHVAGEPGRGAGTAASVPAGLRLVASGVLERPKTGEAAGNYVLLDARGKVAYLVQPADAWDLQSYLGRPVEVVGRVQPGGGRGPQRLVAETLAPTGKVTPAYFVEAQEGKSAIKAPAKTGTVPVPGPAASAPAAAPVPSAAPAAGDQRSAPANTDTPPPLLPPLQNPLPPNGEVFLDSGEPVPQNYEPAPDVGPPAGEAACNTPEWVYVRADYLWWRAKGMSLPPLMTTSPPGTPQADAGVLGAAGTQIVFGGGDAFADTQNGVRLRLGGWLGPRRRVGLELEAFGFADNSLDFLAGSNGKDILARPFTNVDPNLGAAQGPDSALISYPNLQTGFAVIQLDNQFMSGRCTCAATWPAAPRAARMRMANRRNGPAIAWT